jgi:hypothetical protein
VTDVYLEILAYPHKQNATFSSNVGEPWMYIEDKLHNKMKNAVFWAPPEDGGDIFLRNVGLHKIYTAPHPRRRHSL